MAAGLVEICVTPDLEHPGAKTRLRAVSLAVLQNAEEDFLNKVFTGRPISRKVQEIMEQRSMVTVEEQLQPGHVAVPDFLHRLFVPHFHPVYDN
jgi:hypothetical protein